MNRVGTIPAGAALLKLSQVRACWIRMRGLFRTREANVMAQRLREREKWMDLAAEAAHLGMWIWDVGANAVRLSAQCCELFGLPEKGNVTYEAFLHRIHPKDREAAHKAMRDAIAEKSSYHIEHRLLLPDGTLRYVEASGRLDCDDTGESMRILGVCIDISERRRAEEAARELSGRLINAQEEERRRIARELHDDLNQRLALLSVEMELLHQSSPGPEEQRARLEQVAARVKELSSEVHKLSYQLHPAKLDQLGLVAAGRSFCRELSQQSGLRIDFLPDKVPRRIPTDAALCLYRVIQESLQNVVRHSGAPEAKVHLQRVEDHLHLVIVDSGRGFDLESARRTGGLGLISMQERIRLVHGSITIRSEPGRGTQISLDVPLPKDPS